MNIYQLTSFNIMRILPIVLCIALAGCGPKFHKYDIGYLSVGNYKEVNIVDRRTSADKEQNYDCSLSSELPQVQIGDGNFVQNRIESLGSKLDSLLSNDAKKERIEIDKFNVKLVWPNDCARSLSLGSAGLAGVSYTAAILASSAWSKTKFDKKTTDHVFCEIEGVVSGEKFSVSDAIPIHGPAYQAMGPALFLEEMKFCLNSVTENTADKINQIVSTKSAHNK